MPVPSRAAVFGVARVAAFPVVGRVDVPGRANPDKGLDPVWGLIAGPFGSKRSVFLLIAAFNDVPGRAVF